LGVDCRTATPSTLSFTALKYGACRANWVNLLLAGAGLQARVAGHWQPLDAGREFASILDTGKRHGNGAPIQQVKWASAVLPLLKTEEAA